MGEWEGSISYIVYKSRWKGSVIILEKEAWKILWHTWLDDTLGRTLERKHLKTEFRIGA